MRFITFSMISLIGLGSAANGEEIAFAFEGDVTQFLFEPFGLTLQDIAPEGQDLEENPFIPVTGRLVYDTDAPVSHDSGNCDCVGYRQQIIGGFSANIGAVHVRADDYVVEVTNDFLQSSGETADIISIRFSDNLDPAPTVPMNVGGVQHSRGEFGIYFWGDELISTSDLPTELELDDFNRTNLNLLTDATFVAPPLLPGSIGFNITSLVPSPVVSGDYNFDGIVDSLDFQVWMASFGSTGDLSADGNRSGIVDAADYTVWRDARQTAIAVPETNALTGLTLGCLLVVSCVLRSRRKGSRHGIGRA